jgi:hypothetical protein
LCNNPIGDNGVVNVEGRGADISVNDAQGNQ